MALTKTVLQDMMQEEVDNFYMRIQNIVDSNGYKLADIAREINISRQMLSSRLKQRMKRITIETMLTMAREGLGVPLLYLFQDEYNKDVALTTQQITRNVNNLLFQELVEKNGKYALPVLKKLFHYEASEIYLIKQGVLKVTLNTLVKAHVVFGIPYSEMLEGKHYDKVLTKEITPHPMRKKNEDITFERYGTVRRYSFNTIFNRDFREWITSSENLSPEVLKQIVDDYRQSGRDFFSYKWITNSKVESNPDNYIVCSKRPKDKTNKFFIDGHEVRNIALPNEETIINNMLTIRNLGSIREKTDEEIAQLGFYSYRHKDKVHEDYYMMEAEITNFVAITEYLKEHPVFYLVCYYPEDSVVDKE